MWCPSTAPATVTETGVSTQLALIAALDTDRDVWFTLTHANTDSDVMLLYLTYLCRQLDWEKPDWRDDSVVLLDGTKYHTGEKTRETMKKIGVPVIFSGPYSYSTAPIELLFSGLKRDNLNPAGQKLGKK